MHLNGPISRAEAGPQRDLNGPQRASTLLYVCYLGHHSDCPCNGLTSLCIPLPCFCNACAWMPSLNITTIGSLGLSCVSFLISTVCFASCFAVLEMKRVTAFTCARQCLTFHYALSLAISLSLARRAASHELVFDQGYTRFIIQYGCT